ncbi:hypothetical protein [Paenibacillus daejeonensis]|uniref:hypothetical protein n=1 Tax=Paenibacillus daejeonensis TaxID=135193 RepID=UPI00039F8A59|nr:hypothetical protein [Paenibacillus daejeonensis]
MYAKRTPSGATAAAAGFTAGDWERMIRSILACGVASQIAASAPEGERSMMDVGMIVLMMSLSAALLTLLVWADRRVQDGREDA